MFLAEPPPSQYDLHFALFGFPVRIHPLFWLSALLLSGLGNPLGVAMWVAAMLVCILLHELGHTALMQAYGYRPSIVLYSFGGLAIPHPGRNGVRRPGPWGDMLIAFGGPASGFLLAAVLALGLHYLGGYEVTVFDPTWRDVVPEVFMPRHPYLHVFVNLIFQITVYWGLLNLLPIYPLDGGQIAQQIFVLTHPQDALRQSLILSVIVGGMMGVIAFVQLHSPFLGILFLWLTYSNFTALQSTRGGWH